MDEWWTTFFAGNWLDVQRNVRAQRTSDEVAFLEQHSQFDTRMPDSRRAMRQWQIGASTG